LLDRLKERKQAKLRAVGWASNPTMLTKPYAENNQHGKNFCGYKKFSEAVIKKNIIYESRNNKAEK
jgi:hypothetical protein